MNRLTHPTIPAPTPIPETLTMTDPAPPPKAALAKPVLGSAVMSDCEHYRYLLARQWGPDDGTTACWIMLNPSTADGLRDDPTLRRVVGYARAWGHASVLIVNLYGWRATNPAVLRGVDDPVGPDNDLYIRAAAQIAHESGGPVIAAWGARAPQARVDAVHALPGLGELKALDVTTSGQPRHPLYLPAGLTPRPWPRGGEAP